MPQRQVTSCRSGSAAKGVDSPHAPQMHRCAVRCCNARHIPTVSRGIMLIIAFGAGRLALLSECRVGVRVRRACDRAANCLAACLPGHTPQRACADRPPRRDDAPRLSPSTNGAAPPLRLQTASLPPQPRRAALAVHTNSHIKEHRNCCSHSSVALFPLAVCPYSPALSCSRGH